MLRMVGDRDAIKAALAERYRELLPADRFVVEVNEIGIRMEASEADGQWAGGGLEVGFLELRLPLPTSLRLKLLFKARAESLQDFASGVLRQAWPAEGATPHVRVTKHAVHDWYGTGDERSRGAIPALH